MEMEVPSREAPLLCQDFSIVAPMEPADQAETVAMEQREALQFANRNAFKFPPNSPVLARCVDGRYTSEDAQRAPLSAPGADAGYALVAFAALRNLGITVEKRLVWQKVVEACGGEKNFRFHTDTHATHQERGAGRGCGHLALAADPEHGGLTRYGVPPEEMTFLFDQLERLAQKNPTHQVVLEGKHLERAVLVIESDTFGVAPMEAPVKQGGRPNQVFVFQRTLHQKRMGVLADRLMEMPGILSATIRETLLQTLHRVFDQQLNATLQVLAPGDPVHEIQLS